MDSENLATIIGNKFTSELKYKLLDLNYNVVENDMSEFLLSGGSTKCCVLDIERTNVSIPKITLDSSVRFLDNEKNERIEIYG